jgi:hypothetical protein
MGGYASKSQPLSLPKQQSLDLSGYIGQPYPYVLLKLHEQGKRAFLVALKKDEEYQPSANQNTKNAVIILYDAETANVLQCIHT